MIKICSWNIQAGGGSRGISIVKAIIKSKSNIVTLNEFRNNDAGNRIRNYFLKAGYRYQAVTNAGQNDNSVLIVSTIPFTSVFYPDSDPLYSSNILGAKFSAFTLIGVYFPHKKKHQLLHYLTTLVEESNQSYIIAGDYNTGVNFIDQKKDSFWYTDQLDRFQKIGYIDAFRMVNGDVPEFSWYSHQGNGYRYDHTFIDKKISGVITNCYYNHDWRIDKLSDHSPMFIELG